MSVLVYGAGASPPAEAGRGVAHAPSPDLADATQAWALLAPAVAGRPRVRVSRDGGRTYPGRAERALDGRLPAAPAAVMLFDAAGDARCLAADFDVSRGGRAQVDADAAAFAELVATCGGRAVADLSPTGGRHVYVFWSRPVPISELRPLMQALASRYRSLDATPMLNPSAGCIRPPGARHRTGGCQVLTTALPAAQAAVATPCGPQVWVALLDVLRPPPAAPRALAGPAVPAAARLPGPRRPVSERIERIARTGLYDTDRYATPSEARQAVITAAAAAGWTLADLAARLEQGTWAGLAELYARYRRGVRTALTRDWRKALDFLSREKNGPRSTTRVLPHSAPSPLDLSLPQIPAGPDLAELATGDVYGWIRCWQTGMLTLERRGIGHWTPARRLLWRSLGAFAQRTGSTTLEVGRRALAIDTGLDDSTASELLRELRDADDPWIVLIANERGLDLADLYQLRIPDAVADTAAWRAWRAGRIEALHPVFRVLGPPAALAYEALTGEPAQRRDLARDAALPDRTLNRALTTLAEHGLAERLPHAGWRRGPADPDTLAEALGATELVQDQINAYAVERAAFRAAHGLPTANPAPTAYAGPEAPTWWLDQLDAPDPAGPDDDVYDQALADTSTGLDERERHQSALNLLRAELAAVQVSDTLVDWTDPRYGVYGGRGVDRPASAPARAP